MATINKILMPHRGTVTVMEAKPTLVLQEGELFVEGPAAGIGKGHHKIKIGDGVTPYSSLPYALGDTDNEVTNALITFVEDTSESISEALGNVASGYRLSVQIAALKKAIDLTASQDLPTAAFTTITDGTTDIDAGSTSDTLTISAGSNVSLDVDAVNKSITIKGIYL